MSCSVSGRPPARCSLAQGQRQRALLHTAPHPPQQQQQQQHPCRCRLAPLAARRRGAMAAAAGPNDVFVLDFDGVLCDSEREVSTSAFEACRQLWPQQFGSLADSERARVMEGLRAARPRLVKGFEAMVMARLILEDDGWV